ncbi:chemotaxis protein CheW [Donghicola tyrosinivorans]|uniref:Purine-binding chemotaxis protein CheW n=1 Tax=Donghicola tyrosinivorans TaxID=1652492 RepID=A0A2T0WF89_9RHOB|nr:chemotaxis protein CheW [Donghicola tyrosinivorans]PRY85377.1 purine-binding chemotaxis protein CheW [Donghicola tyrosinivorans]
MRKRISTQVEAKKSAGTYLIFQLAGQHMSVPVDRVREILDAREIQPLPQAPKYIMGFIDLRGDSIMVIDLRTLLSEAARADDLDTRIIVLMVNSGDKEQILALRTDKVLEVASFDNDRIEPIETGTILNWDRRIVSGLARREGQYISVLDLDRMMSTEVVASLKAAHKQLDANEAVDA